MLSIAARRLAYWPAYKFHASASYHLRLVAFILCTHDATRAPAVGIDNATNGATHACVRTEHTADKPQRRRPFDLLSELAALL